MTKTRIPARNQFKLNSSKGKNFRAAAREQKARDVPLWADEDVLSPAISQYIDAIVDPFEAPPCSLPNQPPLMTRPAKYWTKGTFSSSPVAGAGGVGFVIMNPGSGISNNTPSVLTNSAALALPQIDITTAGAFTNYFSNADYPAADFGAAAKQGRVVAAGLRIRNITPNLSRGGQCIGLASPAHETLSGLTVTNLDAFQESARHGGKDLSSWIEVTWRPVDTDDYDFMITFPAANQPNGATLGFIVVAPSGSPQTYEFEAYGIYELQGQLVTSKTFSVADSKGFDAVSNSLVAAPKLHKPHVRDEKMRGAAKLAANFVVKHMSTHGGPAYPPPKQEHKNILTQVLDMAPSFLNAVGTFF